MSARGNEAALIEAIFELGSATRGTLEHHCGVSHGAVSSSLERLLGKRLVRTAGKRPAVTGRPSLVYELTEAAGASVGVTFDVGCVTMVAVDAAKRVVSVGRRRRRDDLEARGEPGHLLESISEACGEAAGMFPHRTPDAIGVGLAGLVNPTAGTWVSGLRVRGVDHLQVREFLQDRFGVPVVVEDVARAATYYESTVGAARVSADLVVLHVGMGVGSGVVARGRLYGGHHGAAGEIGHLVVDPQGYRCLCGNIGCLETVLSVPGILRRFNDRRAEVGLPPITECTELDGGEEAIEAILSAAQSGDRMTQSVLFEIGGFLGDAIVKVVSLFDPETVVVTGVVARLGDYLIDAVRQEMHKRTVVTARPDLAVSFAPYEYYHEATGAAFLAMVEALGRRVKELV